MFSGESNSPQLRKKYIYYTKIMEIYQKKYHIKNKFKKTQKEYVSTKI